MCAVLSRGICKEMVSFSNQAHILDKQAWEEVALGLEATGLQGALQWWMEEFCGRQ